MDGKKISFGFLKTKKADIPHPQTEDEEKREYIECVEDSSIKIIGGNSNNKKPQLVIPMQPNTLSVAPRNNQMVIIAQIHSDPSERNHAKGPIENLANPAHKPAETLEQTAARELLEDATRKELNYDEIKCMEVPMPALPKLDGSKEPTLEDYDAVPVGDFGLAMLRGMGWKEGQEKKYTEPQIRPKGLGLGADRTSKGAKHIKNDDSLKLVKGCYVKVTGGNLAGKYAKVTGFDDDSGRVNLELSGDLGNGSVSEEMVEVVPKVQYDNQFRVINKDKYEEYKRNENVKKENAKQAPCKEVKEDVKRRSHNDNSNDNNRKSETPERRSSKSKNSTRESGDKVNKRKKKIREVLSFVSKHDDRDSKKEKSNRMERRSTEVSSYVSEDDKRKGKSRRRKSTDVSSYATDDDGDSRKGKSCKRVRKSMDVTEDDNGEKRKGKSCKRRRKSTDVSRYVSESDEDDNRNGKRSKRRKSPEESTDDENNRKRKSNRRKRSTDRSSDDSEDDCSDRKKKSYRKNRKTVEISSNESEDDEDNKKGKTSSRKRRSTDDVDDSSYRRESDKKRKGKKKRRDRSRSRPHQRNLKRKR